jgi:hypothetical protein
MRIIAAGRSPWGHIVIAAPPSWSHIVIAAPPSVSHAPGWAVGDGPPCAQVLADRFEQHPIHWTSAEACWDAMTRAGPWHAMRLRRGDAFVDGMRDDFITACGQLPPGATGQSSESPQPGAPPLTHAPRARILVLRKPPQAEAR